MYVHICCRRRSTYVCIHIVTYKHETPTYTDIKSKVTTWSNYKRYHLEDRKVFRESTSNIHKKVHTRIQYILIHHYSISIHHVIITCLTLYKVHAFLNFNDEKQYIQHTF